MNSKVVRSCLLILLGISLGAATAQAQLLNDRLVPPQQVVQSPIPMVTRPEEPRGFSADKPRTHLWAPPLGSFPGTSTLLAIEQRPPRWRRPAVDIPGLASEADPARPHFPMLLVAPRTHAPAPDPAQPPVLARFPSLTEPLVTSTEDPGAAAAFSVLTAAVPLATPGPAPLLRLSIPDPFEQIRTIRLAVAPADADAPVTARDRPPLAKLPPVQTK